MTEPTGRREANKQATRRALRSAAKELFADQGFEQTTVRDIARAANVTERTFYRYFDGKEDLVSEEYLSLLSVLKDAICDRPADEPPLTAVQAAMISVARRVTTAAAGGPMWLVSGPPVARLWRASGRPLVRLEGTIAAGIKARSGPGAEEDPDYEFRVQVIARVSVAALRSAIIQLRSRPDTSEAGVSAEARSSELERLINEAFAVIRDAPSLTL